MLELLVSMGFSGLEKNLEYLENNASGVPRSSTEHTKPNRVHFLRTVAIVVRTISCNYRAS